MRWARWLKSDPELRTVPLVRDRAGHGRDRDRVLAAGSTATWPAINPETFVRQMEVFLRPGSILGPSLVRRGDWRRDRATRPRATILVVDNLPVKPPSWHGASLEPSGFKIITAGGDERGVPGP